MLKSQGVNSFVKIKNRFGGFILFCLDQWEGKLLSYRGYGLS